MLTDTFYSPSDTAEIEKDLRRSKKIVKIAIPVILIMDTVLAILTYDMLDNLFIPFVLLLVIMAFFSIRVLLSIQKKFERDLAEQMKWKGKVKVVSKKVYKNSCYISTDDEGAKDLSVSPDAYKQISEGDELEIEMSKHAKKVFLLVKDGIGLQ
jgi:hypothetical protein